MRALSAVALLAAGGLVASLGGVQPRALLRRSGPESVHVGSASSWRWPRVRQSSSGFVWALVSGLGTLAW